MKYEIWMRTRETVNTDPQRRCYNGCNFSERVDHGPWQLFQTWESLEFTKLVAKGLSGGRYEVEVREAKS